MNKVNSGMHEKAKKFWSTIPWYLTNKEIQKIHERPYTCVAENRKIYAPETLKKRVNWKSKVTSLINGEINYFIASDFCQQAGARVAGYKLNTTLRQKICKNNKMQMFLKG